MSGIKKLNLYPNEVTYGIIKKYGGNTKRDMSGLLLC